MSHKVTFWASEIQYPRVTVDLVADLGWQKEEADAVIECLQREDDALEEFPDLKDAAFDLLRIEYGVFLPKEGKAK